MQRNGRLYYIHNDPLGTPRAITSSTGVRVWAQYHKEAFRGQVNDVREFIDETGAYFVFPLRFPGQYHDQATGLFYNYYRYYDPDIGRYITSDPIGLNGGINTYAYVESNPLNLIDPDGLNGIRAGSWGNGSRRGGGLPPSTRTAFNNFNAPYLIRQIQQIDPSFSYSTIGRLNRGYSSSDVASLRQYLNNAQNAGFCGLGASRSNNTGFKGNKGFQLQNASFQPNRNSPANIGGRGFSGHALDQMQNRGIMPSVVENAIRNGQPFSTRSGTSGFHDSVNNIRVITNAQTGRVVTVIPGAP